MGDRLEPEAYTGGARLMVTDVRKWQPITILATVTRLLLASALGISISSCALTSDPEPFAAGTQQTSVTHIADAYLNTYATMDPLEARLWGVDTPGEALLGDNSLSAKTRWMDKLTFWSGELNSLDASKMGPDDLAVFVYLTNRIDTEIALQSCRRELWPLSHVSGWHLNLVTSMSLALEELDGTPTPAQVTAWAEQIVRYIDVEESNLRVGLSEGFSTPRSVSLQVADQFDTLAATDGELANIGSGLNGETEAAWRNAFIASVAPRLERYADFIRDDYAPLARTSRSLAVLPNGAECYAASVRLHTGADLTSAELVAWGAQTERVADERLSRAGASIWGIANPAEVRDRLKLDEPNLAADDEVILIDARATVQRLSASTARLFPPLPENSVRVATYPVEQRGGMVASYQPNAEAPNTGTFWLNPDSPRIRDSRSLEVIAAHEVAPGHHIQDLLGHKSGASHPILALGINNAFVEGWGRYAEALAVEEGLLEHPESALTLWSDWGGAIRIEVRFHSGEVNEAATARAILARRGIPDGDIALADPALDWISVMPGQILAYDFGAEFILQLRARAESALGERFDYPTFHRLILEEGSVPLDRLEQKIAAWIQEETLPATY
jgi:uncharacterized protein (DUF885 family)